MNIVTLLNAKQVFNQFSQTKISSKLAYKIMKFCKSVGIEEEFYEKKRAELIETYSEKDEYGKPIIEENGVVRIQPDKMSEANMAIKELNNMEVDVPNIKFELSMLDELKLSVLDMYALDKFIEGE